MTQSKSFLTLCSSLLLCLASCATLIRDDFPGTFISVEHPKKISGTPHFISSTGFTVSEADFSAQSKVDAFNGKELFDHLCKSGTQRRPLKVNYSYVLPRVPSGIPLDEANQLRNAWIDSGKSFAAHFFSQLSKNDSFPEQLKTPFETLFPKDRIDQAYFSAIDSNSLSGLETKFTSFGTKDAQLMRDPVILSILESENSSNKKKESTLVVSRSSHLFSSYFYTSEFRENHRAQFWMNKSPAWMNRPKLDIYRITNTVEVTPFEDKSTKPVDRPLFGETKIAIPMTVAFFTEALLLRSLFTMLIPIEVQSEIFPGTSSFGYVGNEVSPSLTLKQSDAIWTKYFDTMSTIQESPSTDPQVLNYSVQLNLEPFCKYGRLKSDLVSK